MAYNELSKLLNFVTRSDSEFTRERNLYLVVVCFKYRFLIKNGSLSKGQKVSSQAILFGSDNSTDLIAYLMSQMLSDNESNVDFNELDVREAVCSLNGSQVTSV